MASHQGHAVLGSVEHRRSVAQRQRSAGVRARRGDRQRHLQEVEREQFVDEVPGIVMRSSKQSGANTVDTVTVLEAEIALINEETDASGSGL